MEEWAWKNRHSWPWALCEGCHLYGNPCQCMLLCKSKHMRICFKEAPLKYFHQNGLVSLYREIENKISLQHNNISVFNSEGIHCDWDMEWWSETLRLVTGLLPNASYMHQRPQTCTMYTAYIYTSHVLDVPTQQNQRDTSPDKILNPPMAEKHNEIGQSGTIISGANGWATLNLLCIMLNYIYVEKCYCVMELCCVNMEQCS